MGQKKVAKHPEIQRLFEETISAHLAGCPMRESVRWTNLKTSGIVSALAQKGVLVSRYLVRQMAHNCGLKERSMSKIVAGKEVEKRDQQFQKIAQSVASFQQRGLPVLSVDTKKKEFIGQLYRAGKSYCGRALPVQDHDYPSLAAGVVVPHGLYDVTRNTGYMSLGQSRDTSEFLCDNLRHHWKNGLSQQYPQATELLLLMDGGGSNSCLHYIVKQDLQKLACELQLRLTIAHYPAYCSKYNPIEHRLFSQIQRSWEGVFFESYQKVQAQTEKTTTAKGLNVVAWLNDKVYQCGRKYSQNFRKNMKIQFDPLLPKWNYQINPL